MPWLYYWEGPLIVIAIGAILVWLITIAITYQERR
jgi:hypothetical protein